MYVFGYLRASTSEQDATRAKKALRDFALMHNKRVAGWYVDNISGTTMNRPELLRLLDDAEPGDVILIEQVDRLSRLDDEGWNILRRQIADKQLSVVSLDLPTSYLALNNSVTDSFTHSMLKAINAMMLDMLAAISRKDYEDRRRRQAEGIVKAREQGRFRGRVADLAKHELIRNLRITQEKSINETARLAGVSRATVIRVCRQAGHEGKS
ncbi:serine recombinase [Pantoea sp. Al-1710]|uniref:Serine recombinase n=2 Tax=Pantoea TaxID=53335 RepID=A0ABX0R614_9GAMM|nr:MULTISPECIES: recombinase family protein [Pantoea]MDF7651818.1 recombinase family protein [Erwiniaceae bacterium L1_54_3]NIF03569.1 serine recombinase [Pantoea formicae]NIG22363.1 serine recombinase [Pantoea communis]